MEQIIKLITKRNYERKILSNDDIKKISLMIIKLKRYELYVENIIFSKKDEGNTVATYDGNELCFYKNGLDYLKSCSTNDGSLEGSRVDLINFQILSSIFHEFAHVRQFLMSESYSGSEAKIYRICEKLYNIDNFYINNYEIMPNEINAFALGNLNAYKIYQNIPNNIVNIHDKNIYKSIVIDIILSEYMVDLNKEIIKSPSELLLDRLKNYDLSKINLNYEKIDSIIKSFKDYSLYHKLLVGMPISFENYAYVNMYRDNNDYNNDYTFIKKFQKRK